MQHRRKAFAILAVPLVLAAALAARHDDLRGAAFVIQAADMKGPVRTVAEWQTDDVT